MNGFVEFTLTTKKPVYISLKEIVGFHEIEIRTTDVPLVVKIKTTAGDYTVSESLETVKLKLKKIL